VCGDDDLLPTEILCVWTGDIFDDAERVGVGLKVISPSVLPNIVCVCMFACVCACEVAVRTSVRRLIWRFPKPVRFRDSRYSSADHHSAYTGRSTAVCRACCPAFATAVAVVVYATVRASCITMLVMVVWADLPKYP